MRYVEVEYDRQRVNKAGTALRNAYRVPENILDVTIPSDADWQDTIDVVNNWRSSHAYPLNAILMNLRTAAKRFDPKTLHAQRIKRLVSIAHKLNRFDSMRLSQMQDLGGCRAILQNIADVRGLVDYYATKSRQKHEIATTDNYIDAPKVSGYRGVHLVFKYHSNNRFNEKYNGLKIEMQLRSRYQHAWATAVETVGTFSGQALKSSLGNEDWQRFFTLMGSVIAMRERAPLVPDTPGHRRALLSELAEYAKKLNVVERLRGYRRAVRALQSPPEAGSSYFLLQLDPTEGTVSVTGYSRENILEAARDYAEAEKAVASSKSGADSVLVSVESINNLGRAYPNYFADTRVFLQLMEQALSGHSRGIEVPEVRIEPAAAPPQQIAPSPAVENGK